MSQIGKFSFILSKTGFDSGIIPEDLYQLFLDVAVLTMKATSILMAMIDEDDGIKLLALHRDFQTIASLDGRMLLQADDIVVLMGPEEMIDKISVRFSE